MSIRVEVSPDADAQAVALDEWWGENRPAAETRVATEIGRIIALLEVAPDVGAPYLRRGQKHVRWLHLRGTPYKLYYRHAPGSDLVTIVAVWSGARRAGPPLPR